MGRGRGRQVATIEAEIGVKRKPYQCMMCGHEFQAAYYVEAGRDRMIERRCRPCAQRVEAQQIGLADYTYPGTVSEQDGGVLRGLLGRAPKWDGAIWYGRGRQPAKGGAQ